MNLKLEMHCMCKTLMYIQVGMYLFVKLFHVCSNWLVFVDWTMYLCTFKHTFLTNIETNPLHKHLSSNFSKGKVFRKWKKDTD